jgi:hypothetical protein
MLTFETLKFLILMKLVYKSFMISTFDIELKLPHPPMAVAHTCMLSYLEG